MHYFRRQNVLGHWHASCPWKVDREETSFQTFQWGRQRWGLQIFFVFFNSSVCDYCSTERMSETCLKHYFASQNTCRCCCSTTATGCSSVVTLRFLTRNCGFKCWPPWLISGAGHLSGWPTFSSKFWEAADASICCSGQCRSWNIFHTRTSIKSDNWTENSFIYTGNLQTMCFSYWSAFRQIKYRNHNCTLWELPLS